MRHAAYDGGRRFARKRPNRCAPRRMAMPTCGSSPPGIYAKVQCLPEARDWFWHRLLASCHLPSLQACSHTLAHDPLGHLPQAWDHAHYRHRAKLELAQRLGRGVTSARAAAGLRHWEI